MDAAAEIGTNPVSRHQIQPEYGDEQPDAGRGCRTRLCDTKFSGANGDMEISIFPVQLPTSRTGNLTPLILLLLYVMTIHTCIHVLLRQLFIILTIEAPDLAPYDTNNPFNTKDSIRVLDLGPGYRDRTSFKQCVGCSHTIP